MRAYFLCLLLALLSATVHSQIPAAVRDPYAQFQRQHVFPGMNEKTCDAVIASHRRMIFLGPLQDQCKVTNTFIRTHQNIINNICKRAGEPYSHNGKLLTKSIFPFDIVVCTLDDPIGNTHRPCRYTGKSKTHRIAIACDQGWPVHYGRDILQID